MDELMIETRECGKCEYFKMLRPDLPICAKMLIGVHDTMQVPYRRSIGSCFEENSQELSPALDITSAIPRRQKLPVPA